MRLYVLVASVLLFTSAAAYADPVTYTYTGQYFTNVTGSYSTSDRVTGSFTVASPFAHNYIGAFTPTTFSFSDGVQTLNSQNAILTSFNVTTDAQGVISSYDLSIYTGPKLSPNEITLGNDGFETGSAGFIGSSGGYVSVAGLLTSAITPTPEPSSFALLGTGVLGMIGVMRKRFA